ncbi:MAG: uroporphyrinogen-III synthase [Gemmatimonadaceae bacterium]|nr:uroporphyrinogen-III synthase [Gemmatimonadaceae bacterium]
MFRNDVPAMDALGGVRIVVLRSEGRGGPLAAALRQAGATVTEVALMHVDQLDAAPLTASVAKMSSYQWLVLASPHAVPPLETSLAAAQVVLGACKLAVVGDATGDAVEATGWPVVLTPERSGTDGLIDAMATRSDVDGAHVLYPAADSDRDSLPAGLRALGAMVDVVPVFRVVPDAEARRQLRALIADGAFDLVTVSVPGTLDALLEAIPPEHVRRVPVACVGPVAARAARKAGFPVKVEAENPSPATLARRIVAAFRSSR